MFVCLKLPCHKKYHAIPHIDRCCSFSAQVCYGTFKRISMAGNLQVLWAAPPGAPDRFPCVECGLLTRNFCDGGLSVGYDNCFASNRVAKDYPGSAGYYGFRTPLCSFCETCFEVCRFCRGVKGCTPPTTDRHWSNWLLSQSRRFTAFEFKRCTEIEWVSRDIARSTERQDEEDRRDLQASLRTCAVCSKVECRMKKCGRCKKTHYCSISCQSTDWPVHKLSCRSNVKT